MGRLPQEAAEQIVARIAGSRVVPRRVLDRIVERADGVPLFVEELTKSLVESGVLDSAEDGENVSVSIPRRSPLGSTGSSGRRSGSRKSPPPSAANFPIRCLPPSPTLTQRRSIACSMSWSQVNSFTARASATRRATSSSMR
jgi:hypothetical protein